MDVTTSNLYACEEEVMPTFNGKFESVQLEDNITWSVKIRFELSLEVRSMLIECLQVNIDLFVISLHEMPHIDPKVASHRKYCG